MQIGYDWHPDKLAGPASPIRFRLAAGRIDKGGHGSRLVESTNMLAEVMMSWLNTLLDATCRGGIGSYDGLEITSAHMLRSPLEERSSTMMLSPPTEVQDCATFNGIQLPQLWWWSSAVARLVEKVQ